MQSSASTVSEYLSSLPQERRDAISAVRKVIVKNLRKGFEETMQYGMITYVVPLKLYPSGYRNDKKMPLPYVSLASQKNHMAVYLMNINGDKETAEWFKGEFKKAGKKLEAGKSCIRFKKLDDLPLPVIGKAVAKTSVKDWIAVFEERYKK